MKKILLTLFIFFCFLTIKTEAQSLLRLGIGGGINYGKPTNLDDRFGAKSYELNSLLRYDIYLVSSYVLNPKWELYLNFGALSTGFERRRTANFRNGYPVHLIETHMYEYLNVTLGVEYKIKEATGLIFGIKSLSLASGVNESYGMFYISKELRVGRAGAQQHSTTWLPAENYRFQDMALELGFTHNLWKGLFFKAYYLLGLRHINANEEDYKMKNRAVSFSMGYQFGIIKKKGLPIKTRN